MEQQSGIVMALRWLLLGISVLIGGALASNAQVFEINEKSKPDSFQGSLSLEGMSNRNHALYFEVQYSGNDDWVPGFRTFRVDLEAGLLNAASLSNSAVLLNAKIYPLSRIVDAGEWPLALHFGKTHFQSDYALGANAILSVRLLGASTEIKIPAVEEFFIGLSANVLGAYLVRAYSTDLLGPGVQNRGLEWAYYDASARIGMDFGKVRVTLLNAHIEQGYQISIGNLYGEISTPLAEDLRGFIRYGRRWIDDPQAGVHGNFTDWIRLGFEKPLR